MTEQAQSTKQTLDDVEYRHPDPSLYEETHQQKAELEDALSVCTENLQVKLTFQVASLNMSFGELKNMNAGYVFDLEKRLKDQPISIYANEVLLARGELVSVGEFLGVRITRICPGSI